MIFEALRIVIMRLNIKNIALLAVIAGAVACGKIRQIPPEPHIEFRQLELFDTIEPELGNPAKAARITFYFEDGDGDIGIGQPIEGEVDTLNLFFTAFTKKDGLFVESTSSDNVQSTSFRIPYIERTGQNQIIQGTIDIILFYYFFSLDDTVKYEFYLKDRAGNLSNVEETCEVPFSLLGTCKR